MAAFNQDKPLQEYFDLVHDNPMPVPPRIYIFMWEFDGPNPGCGEFTKPDVYHCPQELHPDSDSFYCAVHQEHDPDKDKYPVKEFPNIWEFGSTDEAYNHSQVRDDIKDGDIFIVKSEKVIGFLIQAWPTAVTRKKGQFHGLRASGFEKMRARYPKTFTNLAVLVDSMKW